MQAYSKYDVLIIGGGMVGLTLALALEKDTDLSIAVIEGQALSSSWQKEQYHVRVSAITLASKRILQAINVWSHIARSRISPFHQIKVWNEYQPQHALQFSAGEINAACLGYIIENNLIQETLLAAVKQSARIDLVSEKVVQYEQQIDAVSLTLENGQQLQGKLLVGADGANSWLRRAANIDVQTIQYKQTAIVATVQMEKAHDKIARQAFLEEGPLGMLPLADPHLISIVWSKREEEAERLLNLDEAAFKTELTKATCKVLGEVIKVEERKIFPLKKLQAKTYIDTRIALIGDAAHVVHPLAGQGVNMGLLDAAALHEVIVSSINQGKDYTDHACLRRYERWRKADNYFLIRGIDIIKAAFESKHAYLRQSLRVGMRFLNAISILKNIFTRHAVGNRVNLPLLAQSQLPLKVTGNSDLSFINDE